MVFIRTTYLGALHAKECLPINNRLVILGDRPAIIVGTNYPIMTYGLAIGHPRAYLILATVNSACEPANQYVDERMANRKYVFPCECARIYTVYCRDTNF